MFKSKTERNLLLLKIVVFCSDKELNKFNLFLYEIVRYL